MYFDGQLFIADEVLLAITFLTLACRQPKPRFGVTDQPAFWIPNGTAEFRVVRAIAPHPGLSQPGLECAGTRRSVPIQTRRMLRLMGLDSFPTNGHGILQSSS